jgi:hypothetical protein
MNKWTVVAGMACFLCYGQSALAKNSVSQNPQSHFKLSVSGVTLKVTTTTAHKTYPNAGIEILTPGYTVAGNGRVNRNGFFLFSVSDTTEAALDLLGPGGIVEFRICLDSTDRVNHCENKTVTSVANSHYIFITSTAYSGALGGVIGADAICQVAAYQPGSIISVSNLKFKALILTASRYPCTSKNLGLSGSCGGRFAHDWPLIPNSTYLYADGKRVFNTVNRNSVFDGSNPLMYTEQGALSFGPFWTGIQSIFANSSGSDIAGWAYADMNSTEDAVVYARNLATCNDFTSDNSFLNGSYGSAGEFAYSTGLIPGQTWGGHGAFNNTQSSWLSNLFNLSSPLATSLSCAMQLPIVCVS